MSVHLNGPPPLHQLEHALEIREVPASNPRQITLWSSAIPLPEAMNEVARRWKCLMCGYQWREAED